MSDHIHKLQFVERGGVKCETLGCNVYYSEEHILQILDRLTNEGKKVLTGVCECRNDWDACEIGTDCPKCGQLIIRSIVV